VAFALAIASIFLTSGAAFSQAQASNLAALAVAYILLSLPRLTL